MFSFCAIRLAHVDVGILHGRDSRIPHFTFSAPNCSYAVGIKIRFNSPVSFQDRVPNTPTTASHWFVFYFCSTLFSYYHSILRISQIHPRSFSHFAPHTAYQLPDHTRHPPSLVQLSNGAKSFGRLPLQEGSSEVIFVDMGLPWVLSTVGITRRWVSSEQICQPLPY